MNIEVRENEVVLFDCKPADIVSWLDKNIGKRNYNVYWQGYDCLSIKNLDSKHIEWLLLAWN